jgi:hypothetical protein
VVAFLDEKEAGTKAVGREKLALLGLAPTEKLPGRFRMVLYQKNLQKKRNCVLCDFSSFEEARKSERLENFLHPEKETNSSAAGVDNSNAGGQVDPMQIQWSDDKLSGFTDKPMHTHQNSASIHPGCSAAPTTQITNNRKRWRVEEVFFVVLQKEHLLHLWSCCLSLPIQLLTKSMEP